MHYVSAYYHIPKEKLPHMGIARYIRLAPETLQMISGFQLSFYYEEEFVATLIQRLCEDVGVSVDLIRLPLADLPRRQEAMRISRTASKSVAESFGRTPKEKGVAHLRNFENDGSRVEYEDNLSVWLSKIDLVLNVISTRHVDDCPVAWIDIGLSKFNFIRSNWAFNHLSGRNDRVLHYGSLMKFQGRRLPLNASFLRAYPAIWQDLCGRFSEALNGQENSRYPHDEETILAMVVWSRPCLFECAGKPFDGKWGKMQYLYNRLLYRRIRANP